MSKIIGIDLGTTNSCAAIVENGSVKLIPYKGGDFIIPSIFAIDDKGNELIGHEAKRQWQLNPRNTVYAAKRLVGRSFSSDVVDLMKKIVAYEMKPGERNDVVLDVGHKHFRLAEISAKILNKIRGVAQDYLGEKVTRAVVTVPAYFTDRQRQAVKDAGKMIQLEVVRIINEPTAAALAYGIGKDLHETVVIYDLGGGTFDVSIIEIRDRVFEVKATGGDIFLGGLDFDQAMIGYVLQEFQKQHNIDLSGDPVAMQRIKDLAERVKIDLSSREQAPFSVPFVTMTPQGMPLNIDFQFTRKMLEDLTRKLVDRTVEIAARAEEGGRAVAGGRADADAVGAEEAHRHLRQEPEQGRPPRRGRRDRGGALRQFARGQQQPAAAASRRDPHGHRPGEGGRRIPHHLSAQRRDPQREGDRGYHQLRRPDGSGDAHLPGRRTARLAQRAARRLPLQWPQVRAGRKGAPGDHLRREHRGHPHHVGEGPRYRQANEDHRPRHPALIRGHNTDFRRMSEGV